MTVISETRCAH